MIDTQDNADLPNLNKWNQFKTWGENYKKYLSILENDLNLVTGHFKINVAMDFSDLFEQCFPFAGNFRDFKMFKNNTLSEFNERKKIILHREISRYGLILLLQNIYVHPLVLLPPYLSESMDFLDRITNVAEVVKEDYETKSYYIKHVFSGFGGIDENIVELIQKCEQIAPDLIFLFSDHFEEGKPLYDALLKKHIKPYSQMIEEELQRNIKSDPNSKNNSLYVSLIGEIHNYENAALEELIWNQRPYEEKTLQNRRDAKALQYLTEINDRIGNNLLILCSMAPHLIKLQNDRKFIKKIGNTEHPLIRDTIYFYTALVELSNSSLLGHTELNEGAIREIKNTIQQKKQAVEDFLQLIEDYPVTCCLLSGDLKNQYIADSYEIFIKFVNIKNKIERIEILDLFKSLVMERDSLESVGHLNKFSKFDITHETSDSLKRIKDLVSKEKLILEFYIKQRDELKYLFRTQSDEWRRLIQELYKNESRSLSKCCFIELEFPDCVKDVLILDLYDEDAHILKDLLKSRGMYSRYSKLITISRDNWLMKGDNRSNYIYATFKGGVLKIFYINLLFIKFGLEFILSKLERKKSTYLEDNDFLERVATMVIPMIEISDGDLFKEILSDYTNIIKLRSGMN